MSRGKDHDPRFIKKYVNEERKPTMPVRTPKRLPEIEEDPAEDEDSAINNPARTTPKP